MTERANLIGLSFDGLKAALAEAGVADKALPMRARQLWNWIYVHGARDFASMSNLAKPFRDRNGGALHPGAAGDRHRADLQ